MKGLLRAYAVWVLALSGVASAKTFDEYKDIYVQWHAGITNDTRKQIDGILSSYSDALRVLRSSYTQSGDAKAIEAITWELSRLASENTLPKSLPASLPDGIEKAKQAEEQLQAVESAENQRLMALSERYLKALKECLKEPESQKNVAEARRVKEEIARIEFILADAASKVPKEPGGVPRATDEAQEGRGTNDMSGIKVSERTSVPDVASNAGAEAPYRDVTRVLSEAGALNGETISVYGLVDRIERDRMSGSTFLIVLEGGIKCRISRDAFNRGIASRGTKSKPVLLRTVGQSEVKLEWSGRALLGQSTDVIVRGKLKKEMNTWIIDVAVIQGCSDPEVRRLLSITCRGRTSASCDGRTQCGICGSHP